MLVFRQVDLKSFRALILGLFGIPVLLMADSQFGDNLFFGYGQAVSTLLVFIAYVFAYRISTQRVKHVMLIGIIVGLAGEAFFSLGLGMYHYRFGNIPFWLAFAHGLIFALVFRLCRKSWIKKRQYFIQNILLFFAVVYSLFWLMWANDWFGFLCAVAFILILFTVKKSRLFFLIMFAVVCYIEQVGTATGCWYWPETTLDLISWLPSGNPPSGIAVFYFLFDAAVFWIYMYLLHPNINQRYQKIRLGRP